MSKATSTSLIWSLCIRARCWPVTLPMPRPCGRRRPPARVPLPGPTTSRPSAPQDWSYDRAAHLLERAGFGGTPEEIQRARGDDARSRPCGIWSLPGPSTTASSSPSIIPASSTPGSSPSRPAAPPPPTWPRDKGEALGIKVKPAGNRRMQPVVNKFFYWLRASRAGDQPRRLLVGQPHAHHATRPLEEKMALFWHGHFATNEDKVRDYRKMLHAARAVPEHRAPAISATC